MDLIQESMYNTTDGIQLQTLLFRNETTGHYIFSMNVTLRTGGPQESTSDDVCTILLVGEDPEFVITSYPVRSVSPADIKF